MVDALVPTALNTSYESPESILSEAPRAPLGLHAHLELVDERDNLCAEACGCHGWMERRNLGKRAVFT